MKSYKNLLVIVILSISYLACSPNPKPQLVKSQLVSPQLTSNNLKYIIDSLRGDSNFSEKYLLIEKDSLNFNNKLAPFIEYDIANAIKSAHYEMLYSLRDNSGIGIVPEVAVEFPYFQFLETIEKLRRVPISSTNSNPLYPNYSGFGLRMYFGYYKDIASIRQYLRDNFEEGSNCPGDYIKRNTLIAVITYNNMRIKSKFHTVDGEQIQTYFNLGGLCPPGCPQEGINCINALTELL